MADKSSLGLELTEAEIDTLVDTGELLIPEFLMLASLVIYHSISRVPS